MNNLNTIHTQAYLAEDIRRELGLHREELVALAYFLGCDYTDGVTGVGIVNALEIVQAFPMRLRNASDADADEEENGLQGALTVPDNILCDSSIKEDQFSGSIEHYPIVGLNKFKEWLEGYQFSATVTAKQKSILKSSDQNVKPDKGKRIKNSKQSRKRKKSKNKSKKDFNQSGSDSDGCSDSNAELSSESESDADIDNNDSKNDNSGENTRSKDHDKTAIDHSEDSKHDVEVLPGVQAADTVKARRSSRKKNLDTEIAAGRVNKSQGHDKEKSEGEGEHAKENGNGNGKDRERENESADVMVVSNTNSTDIAMNHNKVFTKKSTRMVRQIPFFLPHHAMPYPTIPSNNSYDIFT